MADMIIDSFQSLLLIGMVNPSNVPPPKGCVNIAEPFYGRSICIMSPPWRRAHWLGKQPNAVERQRAVSWPQQMLGFKPVRMSRQP